MKNHDDLAMNEINARFQQAVVHFQQGRLAEAESIARRILDVQPDYVYAHHMLGLAAYNDGRLDAALAAWQRVIQLKPDFVEAHNNCGNVLRDLGRLEESLVFFERAIQLKPDYVMAHNNRGNVLKGLGRPQEALQAYDQAIRLNKNLVEPHVNRGLVLRDLYRLEESLASFDRAIQLEPASAEAYYGSGNALMVAGLFEEGESRLLRALQIKPDYTQARVDLMFSSNYRSDLSAQDVFDRHRKWSPYANRVAAKAFSRLHGGKEERSRRLRIGYISPDFCTHSVAYFFEPLLTAHYRGGVEVYCYSNVEEPDTTTGRIRAKADHWRSIVGLSDQSVVEQIKRDRVDILIDLAGYTGCNSLSVFACKPAPIQVTWLGYPNTTAVPTMDYRFTDVVADPVGEADRLHTETLVRLENGFLCYQAPESAPAISAAPVTDAGYITFGSFNNLAKINAKVVAVWSEILRAVPGSRLVMKNHALSDDAVRQRYSGLFAEYGINAGRVDLCQPLPETQDHLGFYSRIDISLDTFPYNGTTTTCEALWMGVPVVTLAGDRHAARVGASILERAGCSEWVTSTVPSYIEVAVGLASDKQAIAETRKGLRDRVSVSTLCDAEGFAQQIEAAYRQMWERFLDAESHRGMRS